MKAAAIAALILAFQITNSCTRTAAIANPRHPEQQRGFFDTLGEHFTERECNVGRFTCPYGLGPAGEPCDCTDPSGIVLNGRTVK
jgi:hypothetical protein